MPERKKSRRRWLWLLLLLAVLLLPPLLEWKQDWGVPAAEVEAHVRWSGSVPENYASAVAINDYAAGVILYDPADDKFSCDAFFAQQKFYGRRYYFNASGSGYYLKSAPELENIFVKDYGSCYVVASPNYYSQIASVEVYNLAASRRTPRQTFAVTPGEPFVLVTDPLEGSYSAEAASAINMTNWGRQPEQSSQNPLALLVKDAQGNILAAVNMGPDFDYAQVQGKHTFFI